MKRLSMYNDNDHNALDFFFLELDCGEMCFEDVIKEDIIEFKYCFENGR